ncbi:MAG TPA: phosphodiesterase [Solirubrobacteraceae bacterium]|jgi:Icc protein|nr:phosphodiesterase [Solirubrobacteraceae bacterium]
MTLVQLSDLHLRAGDDGHGPAERLRRVVQRVAALQPRPVAVLLSGDLADDPSDAAYEQVRELLAPLGLPIHAIPGNHDGRQLLRAHFWPDEAPTDAPIHFAAVCGPLRLVGCDTTLAGSDGGAMGDAERDWLQQTLGEDRETPTLLAMHHPPVLTGIRLMDEIALHATDRIVLEKLVRSHPQVQAVTCGHVHTTMTTSFAGRPLLICPSTNSAICLDMRPLERVPFSVSQPLGFAVHTLVDGRLVSHVQAVDPSNWQ